VVRKGDKFRSREPIPVTCWWWYDTAAILDDYSDCCAGVLPSGEAFTVDQVSEIDANRVLCVLDRAEALKPRLIPKGRQVRVFLFCSPTRYTVELTLDQIAQMCEPASHPAHPNPGSECGGLHDGGS